VDTLVVEYPELESLDVRTAMRLLARGVMHRSISPEDSARHWFLLWPSIPAPVRCASPNRAFAVEACAA
jgi:hypothetical protein